MRIVTLVENTSCNEECQAKHGLCLYIETSNHKLLFDVGPDDTFIKNARALGVRLEEVDTVIISHGHKDHGGGLGSFLDINGTATIYIQEEAFGQHGVSILGIIKVNIGLDDKLKGHPQIKCIKGDKVIDEELTLFTNPRINELKSKCNNNLYVKSEEGYIRDTFLHEQSLMIKEQQKMILIAGCAHRGITNIINQAELIGKVQLHTAIGGYHLTNPVSLSKKTAVVTTAIGEVLKTKDTKYYTCHCTGEVAYLKLKEMLGEQIEYLATGSSIEL